jgi:Asp-tRNA(Asn)/Glu-tRNA(Gln) amidotransferase A subunit family amidase
MAVSLKLVDQPPVRKGKELAARKRKTKGWRFRLKEATIAEVHRAIKTKHLTVTRLVKLYLKRIEAYNGTGVQGTIDPATGLQLGEVEPIKNSGQLNALITLNVRGSRSKTDPVDNEPKMPDALETARALDAEFKRTGKLKGPLHGIPFAIKDQFDTFDMRTTGAAAAAFANDRPPKDADVVARLRRAGAIILAKANMGELAGGDRSTFGGTTCNPYDTTRSGGRSSGGSGVAVAANLVMCALGEETGPSTRNPAANNSLVGFVATHSLVSRGGLIPASVTRDRPGILCRSVKDAAIVLGVVAGYEPRDPITAASVGRMPARGYASFATGRSLKGIRLGIVREFMQPFSKADEDSIRIANEAIADLAHTGATIIDPGPEGELCQDAIRELLGSLDTKAFVTTFAELFSGSASVIDRVVELSSGVEKLPPHVTLRMIADAPAGETGERQYVINRYLQERGDKNIRDIRDLIRKSTFYSHLRIDGVSPPPKARLEEMLSRSETLVRKSDGSSVTRQTPITELDIRGTHSRRVMLQAVVFKAMADHNLDALVYPTKTVPAPLLMSPLEPEGIKTVKDTVTVVIDGVEYLKTRERILDIRHPLAWRLSAAAGLPAIAVPAGFTREVYDRAVVVDAEGRRRAGDLVGPKAIALPVSIDFLGRPFSEPALIGIAAAYERATRHRRPPKAFPPLRGEP